MKRYVLSLVVSSVLSTSTIYAEGGTICPLKLTNDEFRALSTQRELTKDSVKLSYKGHGDSFTSLLQRNPNPKLDAGLRESTIINDKTEQCRYKIGTDTVTISIIAEQGSGTASKPSAGTSPVSSPKSTATPPQRPTMPSPSVVEGRKPGPGNRPRAMRMQPPIPAASATAAVEDKNNGTFMLQKNPDGTQKIYTFSETKTARDGSTYTQSAERKILFIKGNDGTIYLAYDPREDTRRPTHELMDHYKVVFVDDIEGKTVKFEPTDQKIELEGKQYPLAKLKLEETKGN